MQIIHLRLDPATLSWFRQHFETDQAIKRLYMGPKNGENGIGRAVGLHLDGWRMGAEGFSASMRGSTQGEDVDEVWGNRGSSKTVR